MAFRIFNGENDRYYLRLRQWRDNFFKPLCEWLAKHSIKPAHLTYAGLATIVPFIYFFNSNPGISAIFLVFHLVLDSIDGVLARLTGKSSIKGEFLDQSCDYLYFFLSFLTVEYFGLLNSFWASIYLLNYVIMIYLCAMAVNSQIKIFPVIRSKYGFYGLIFILVIFNQNFFNPCMVLMSVYMVVTNLFLFHRIRWALS